MLQCTRLVERHLQADLAMMLYTCTCSETRSSATCNRLQLLQYYGVHTYRQPRASYIVQDKDQRLPSGRSVAQQPMQACRHARERA